MEPSAEHRRLIDKLVNDGRLKTSRVIEAFLAVNRKYFTGGKSPDSAFEDKPLLIPAGQTISQPTAAAIMLEILSVGRGDKVLEIGTGSGWQTAMLGLMVGESGTVVSLERITELHNFSKKNIEAAGFSGLPVKLIRGDASKISEGAYDKIISGASAHSIPEAWKKILKIGGRMVIPVNDCLVVADKVSADGYEIKKHFGFNFMPLVTGVGRAASFDHFSREC